MEEINKQSRQLSNISMPRAFALMGALGVALGAFGAHALKDTRAPQQLETWKTATLYLLVHSVLGVCLSFVANFKKSDPGHAKFDFFVPRSSLYLFLFGTGIFSTALYALVLFEFSPLGAVAPIGGLMMISGWLILVFRLKI